MHESQVTDPATIERDGSKSSHNQLNNSNKCFLYDLRQKAQLHIIYHTFWEEIIVKILVTGFSSFNDEIL